MTPTSIDAARFRSVSGGSAAAMSIEVVTNPKKRNQKRKFPKNHSDMGVSSLLRLREKV
jgi:hypothetical protein